MITIIESILSYLILNAEILALSKAPAKTSVVLFFINILMW